MVSFKSWKYLLINKFIQLNYKNWKKFFNLKYKKSNSKNKPARPSNILTYRSSSRVSTKKLKSTKIFITSSKQNKLFKDKEFIIIIKEFLTKLIITINNFIEPEESPCE